MSFKKNLRDELYFNSLEIKEFAAKINISYTTMQSYVNKKACLPNVETAYKIARELDVSLEYLITGSEKNLKDLQIDSETFFFIKEYMKLRSEEKKIIKQIIHIFNSSKKETEI